MTLGRIFLLYGFFGAFALGGYAWGYSDGVIWCSKQHIELR
jgi:hypothetical protein